MSKIFRAGRLVIVLIFLLSFILPAQAFEVVNNNPEGNGSLAWAIQQANQGGDSTINIASSVKSITLTRELTIEANVTINGNGVTVSGTYSQRLFRITSGQAAFNRITFTRGRTSSGNGGAVEVDGTNASARFTNCTFYGNEASGFGGAVCVTRGGADPRTAFTHCTVTGNMARNGGGLAVIDGDMALFSSVVTGNTSSSDIYREESSGTLSGRYNVAGKFANYEPDNTNSKDITASRVLVADSQGLPVLESVDMIQVVRLTGKSPAIDFVPLNAGNTLSTDQLGTSRPQLAANDAGAYEARPVPVTSAEVFGAIYIQAGSTDVFSVDVNPKDATLNIRDYPPAGITWSSSQPSIISIDSSGRARAVGIGDARITAQVHGWDASGEKTEKVAQSLRVCSGEEARMPIRAYIASIDAVVMKSETSRSIRPSVTLRINSIDIEGARAGVNYTLTADVSSGSDVLEGLSVSGDTIILMAGNRTGSCDVQAVAAPIPEGQASSVHFSVKVTSSDDGGGGSNDIGRSSGGGGCASGAAMLGAIMAVVLSAKKRKG